MSLNKLIQSIDRLAGFEEASAHCDIPCKIYDPAIALIAASRPRPPHRESAEARYESRAMNHEWG